MNAILKSVWQTVARVDRQNARKMTNEVKLNTQNVICVKWRQTRGGKECVSDSRGRGRYVVCVRVLTVAYNCTRVCSLESRISSLVACAQSIPKSHYAANARERQRVSCWQIAWRLTHSATCCPSAPLPLYPFPIPLPCCTSHFMCVNISKSPSALRAKWFTCQATAPIPPPPPSSSLLPLANSLQFLHLQLPHTHTHSAHTVGIVCFMALLHCPHSPGKFCLAAAATLLLLLQLPLLPLDFVIEI